MKKYLVGAIFATSIVGGAAGIAGAATCPDSTPAGVSCSVEVKGTTIDAPTPSTDSAVAPAVAPALAAKAQLPVTGAETGMIAGAGLALIAGGAVLVARSRKVEGVTP